jgi:hypothetical protein
MSLFGLFGKGEPSFQNVDGFPFEVAQVAGSVAVEKALRWREEWRGSFSPVVLGGGGMDFLREWLEDAEGSVESLLEVANRIDVNDLFARRLKDCSSPRMKMIHWVT